MGSSTLKKPIAKKPANAATEDKTGELPIPAKKPQLVPIKSSLDLSIHEETKEESKTKDLPTPTKIKKMLATEIAALENKTFDDPKLKEDIAEIKNKSLKIVEVQTEIQTISKLITEENSKVIPLLEKQIEEGKKNSEVIGNGLQNLDELKNLISQYHQEYKNEIGTLETKKAELSAEVANLQIVADTYQKTKTQYDALSDEYSLLILQKHELEQDMSKLVISGKDEVVSLQSQKVKCEAELAWIKFELNEYIAKKQIKLQEEADLLSKKELLEKNVSELELKHQDISTQYHEKFSIIENFQTQCDRFVQKIEELKIKEAEEKEEYNRLQIQKKNSEQALAFINVELHEFSIKKENMQFEDAELDQKRVTLNKEISLLEKKHYDISSQARTKAESLASIQAECEKYGRMLESLKKQEIFEKSEMTRLTSEKNQCEHQVSLIKLELHEFQLKKEQKINEQTELDKKRGILEQKISSFELKLEDTSKRFREKTDALSITHEEWQSLVLRVEHLKLAEKHLLTETAELKDALSKLKDAASFSEEKRAHYQAAVKESEENYKTKMDLFERDYQYKVSAMEIELKKREEKGMEEVKARIDETEEAIHRFLNRNQDLLADAIGDAVYVKGQYSLVKTESAPHFSVIKEEIKKVIGNYFHQSVHPNYKEKIMHKIFFYWAISSTIIAASSILLWYFKK